MERKLMASFKGSESPMKININSVAEHKSGKVLVTNTSELVEIIINEKEDIKFLITIDSENLVRAWSIKNNSTTYSYKLPMK